MTNTEIQFVFDLLGQHQTVEFSTINAAGFPETRTVMNWRNNEMSQAYQDMLQNNHDLYFCVHTHSPKVAQLKANPHTSVYFCNETTMAAAILFGKTTVVEDAKVKQSFWQDDWVQYYPQGVDDENYTLLKFTPEAYKYYDEKLQKHEGQL